MWLESLAEPTAGFLSTIAVGEPAPDYGMSAIVLGESPRASSTRRTCFSQNLG